MGNCLHDKSGNWLENHVATKRSRDDEGRVRDRTVEKWKQMLKNFTKAFHPYGKTLEQWDMAWKRLSCNPKSETMEDFTDRVKQLGDMLDKNEHEQVRTIKMSTPDIGTYQAIMRCDTIDEIVETINQLEGFPLIHNPTEATNSPIVPFMTAQQRDKAVTFANDSLFLDSMAELGEHIGSKIASTLSDKMSELANNIDRLSVRVEDYKKSPRKSRRDYSEERDRYRGRSNSRNRSNSRGRYDENRYRRRFEERYDRCNSRERPDRYKSEYRSNSRDRYRRDDRYRDDDRYRRDDRYRDDDRYRRNDKPNQKGKIWCDFCKSMGYHPLEKYYGYMYAQSIVDKHRSESEERKSSYKNINKRNLTPGPERQDRFNYVDD